MGECEWVVFLLTEGKKERNEEEVVVCSLVVGWLADLID